jgi:HlyD family secretion protein
MHRTRLLLLGLAAAIVAAGAIAWLLAPRTPSGVIFASGTIEATESDVTPKVQGRLIDLRVGDGDAVEKGEVLAVLEQTDPAFSLDAALAGVRNAEQQVHVANARLGQASENLGLTSSTVMLGIDEARAQLASATSSYVLARTDLVRARSLVGTGDEPKQTVDDAQSAYASAAAGLQAARDALDVAEANQRNVPLRALDVRASRLQRLQASAALAQAEATLGLARDQVHETRLVAPYDGFVISHNFEVGDLVQAGSPVLTVGDLVHPYVYIYVSETDLPRIKPGMRADVSIDGLPGHTFVGTVTEISNTAEFTPENVQTREQRIEYLVFRVKVQFTDRSGLLKPGLPVDAAIHLE